MTVEQTVDEIFELFHSKGSEQYIGEPLSKEDHSIQCAMLAESEGYPTPVILGAFFHDIGHIIGELQGAKQMIVDGQNYGTSNHAALGAEYLKKRGFPSDVTDIVQAHVQAKRYLCCKDPEYYQKLSRASKTTLAFQGGKMSESQAEEFQSHRQFATFVRMRQWDEAAKVEKMADMKPLGHYKDLTLSYLKSLRGSKRPSVTK